MLSVCPSVRDCVCVFACVPMPTLTSSEDDVVDDLSRYRLRADEADRAPLVQQTVEVLGSLSHYVNRVSHHRIGHMGKVLLPTVHPIVTV